MFRGFPSTLNLNAFRLDILFAVSHSAFSRGKSAFGLDQDNPDCQLYLIVTLRSILFIYFPSFIKI